MGINIALLLAFSASVLFPVANKTNEISLENSQKMLYGELANAEEINTNSLKLTPPGSLVDDSIVERATFNTPKKLEVTEKMVVIATGYSSTPEETDDTPFITASGTTVREGVIATNFLPIGTKLRIPKFYGEKEFIVEDRMNIRYNDVAIIDIWFGDKQDARNFGKRKVEIEIL